MSEVVEVTTAPESQEAEATPEVAPETATPAPDTTTLEKRLRGKDQALTAAQRERDAIKAERDALSAWKAERENADLTELEKAQKELAEAKAEATKARAEAEAIRLKSAYPLAADLLGDDLTKFEESRVAEIDGRLAKEQDGESEPGSRIDPNNPRRPAPKVTPPADKESARAALIAAGNPFADAQKWGDSNPVTHKDN